MSLVKPTVRTKRLHWLMYHKIETILWFIKPSLYGALLSECGYNHSLQIGTTSHEVPHQISCLSSDGPDHHIIIITPVTAHCTLVPTSTKTKAIALLLGTKGLETGILNAYGVNVGKCNKVCYLVMRLCWLWGAQVVWAPHIYQF